jgi:uncharacterized protein
MRNSLAAVLVGAALATSTPVFAQTSVKIAASGAGSTSYAVGSGIAAVLSKAPGYSASLVTSVGQVENMRHVASGVAQIAFAGADLLTEAQKGDGTFKDSKLELQALLVLYPSRLHLIATEGSNIRKISDLKGKRVSLQQPGSGTEIMATRLFEAAGLDAQKDIRREVLATGVSNARLQDGSLDAYFLVGGLPLPGVVDLAAKGVRFRLVDQGEALPALLSKYGGLYTQASIPAKSYPGQDTEISVLGSNYILAVKSDLPEQVAYDIVKAIFDDKAEVAAANAEANNITLERQRHANSPVPFHTGAARYFREKGVTM